MFTCSATDLEGH